MQEWTAEYFLDSMCLGMGDKMVKISGKELEVPIIQGGMGIGVSLGRLAGNVALCGGMGVISMANPGYKEPDFMKKPLEANIRALKQEIRRAYEIAKGRGMIAINAMVAVNHYEELVKAAVEEGVDAIISGAGLPLNLAKLTKGTKTAAAPIVSSGKAAELLCRSWDKREGTIPDFFVIEGPMAGGHLGFSMEELQKDSKKNVCDILPEVLEAVRPYEEKYKRKIPVFVGGGIFDGRDAARAERLGASGVQIGTRFITTEECDASDGFKQVFLEAEEEDAVLIQSPVGMPARAVNTPFLKRLKEGIPYPPLICNRCLKACPGGSKTIYCISRALIEAVKGNIEEGLVFCGSNIGRIKQMTTVKELMEKIKKEWADAGKEATE